MKHLFVFLLSSFLTVSVHAQSANFPGGSTEIKDLYQRAIEGALWDANHLGAPCNTCAVANTGRIEDPACQSTYEDLYSKEPVDMRIMFGYMDYRSQGETGPKDAMTEDRYQAAAMIEKITARGVDPRTGRDRCPVSRNDCGFTRDPDDATKFTRQILGPDRRMHTIALTITYSSVSDNDDENCDRLADQQDQLTKRNRRIFKDGLVNSDVLLYVGHMRKGGGPDFGPPRLIPGTTRVDYNSYHSTPGHPNSNDSMLATLRQSPTRPQLLGVLACDANRYAAGLRSAAPTSGVALAGESEVFSAAFSQAVATLDSVMNFRCQRDFNRLLNSQSRVGNIDISPIAETGFFTHGQRTAVRSEQEPADHRTSTPDADPNAPYLRETSASSALQTPVQAPGAPPVYRPLQPVANPRSGARNSSQPPSGPRGGSSTAPARPIRSAPPAASEPSSDSLRGAY